MNSKYVHYESKVSHLGTITGKDMDKENNEKSVNVFVVNMNELKFTFCTFFF